MFPERKKEKKPQKEKIRVFSFDTNLLTVSMLDHTEKFLHFFPMGQYYGPVLL